MDEILVNASVAAFFGAFFAYIFGRVADFFKLLYERQVKHYNSLVRLEIQLNEVGTLIDDNLSLMKGFKQTIKEGALYFNAFHLISLDKAHYDNLYNLDLLNKLFSFYDRIQAVNTDVNTINTLYSSLRETLIGKHIDQNTYFANLPHLEGRLSKLELVLGDVRTEAINVQAVVRIRMRLDKPLGTRLIHVLIPRKNLTDITEQQLHDEVAIVHEELKQTEQESREKLANLKGARA